jgi:hypothetical protein
LKTKYGELEEYTGDLVVEGAILCNSWFLDSILTALDDLIPADADVYRFYLNVSNETILRNVHRRADENPKHRGHEKQQFRTEMDIAKTHSGFDEAVKAIPGRWIELSSTESLEVALNGLRG